PFCELYQYSRLSRQKDCRIPGRFPADSCGEALMVLAELSMWPMDKGESVGQYVARLLDIIDRSGLPYRLGPLGTCIEGEYDQVMAVIKQCHEALAADCNRVF